MFCKHCYCYCDKIIKFKNNIMCSFCHNIYVIKCNICGMNCNDTCLELFSKVLKIE